MWTPRFSMRIFFRGISTIRDVVKQSLNHVAVLYGSHSGNSEKSATNLHAELKWRLGIDASISNLAKLDFHDIGELGANDILLFLLSTYGDGEPNPATEKFWNQLFLRGCPTYQFNYSVLARGSTLYDNTFAAAGIKVDEKLNSLGAHRLAPRGIQDKLSLNEADEYFQWKEEVISALMNRFNLPEKVFVYHPLIKAEEISVGVPKRFHRNLIDGARPVTIRVNNLPPTDREYITAQLNLSGYKPGDYVVVWPTNSDKMVYIFLEALFGSADWAAKAKQLIRISHDGHSTVTSYKLLAKCSIDINGQPERETLLKLMDMAPSSVAKKRLDSMIQDGKLLRSLAETLAEASPERPWIESLPVSALIDILPPLQPRRYSISSTDKENPEWAEITAVVEQDDDFVGVTTGELSRMTTGEMLAMIEPLPKFRLPSSEVPLLLFGIGTGVAPFRGFLRDRGLDPNSGPVVLFTGTRTPGDLVHGEELHELVDSNPKFHLIPAYSRTTPDSNDFGRFTDKLAQHHELIFNFIMRGAQIYVCGDARKVRRGVRNGVIDILSTKLNITPKESQKEWKKLSMEGRLHLELW